MQLEPATLTRKQLYEQVWTVPMVRLAAKYGLSDRGLAKLCTRHAIPLPGRGHWAVIAAGHAVRRKPLPTTEPADKNVEITASPVRDEKEHPIVEERIAFEAEHPIRVPDRLSNPHPLIADANDTLHARDGGTTDGHLVGRCNSLPILVSSKQMGRALRILDTLFKACEERGFKIDSRKEDYERAHATITAHGEEMSFFIQEPTKRTDLLQCMTPEERRRAEASYARRYEFTPTGKLVFTIEEWGARHRWADRQRRRLEDCINDIIVGLVRLSVAVLQPRRVEWEREAKRERRAERRREIERAKFEALNEALPVWRRTKELRTFIDAVKREAGALGPIKKGGRIAQWLDWANDVAERSDPVERFVRHLRMAPSGDS